MRYLPDMKFDGNDTIKKLLNRISPISKKKYVKPKNLKNIQSLIILTA